MNLLFVGAGLVALMATFLAITRKQALHAALYVLVSWLAVSACLFALGATLASTLQIVVAAGAILVVIVVAILVLNPGPEQIRQEAFWLKPLAFLGPTVLALGLGLLLLGAIVRSPAYDQGLKLAADAKAVSLSLWGPYLLLVEGASILLLAGLVGAANLVRKSDQVVAPRSSHDRS